jgi:hypothetical protein
MRLLTITTFLCLTLLTACAPFKPNSTKAGACNELNSRMIFNGSTSNIQKSEIQSAQEGLDQRTYDKACE